MPPLHPAIAAELAAAVDKPPYYTLPLEQARAQVKLGYALRVAQVAVARVQDWRIPGPGGAMGLRVYWPRTDASDLPLIAFLHGSGFTMLDLDTHDDICRRLCQGSGAVVVSVDYRLAPEHPYPAALDDCQSVLQWLRQHAHELGADSERMALVGDSAGACLAAATALRLRDAGLPLPSALAMWYPVTDTPDAGHASYRDFAQGYGLTAAGMQWFWSQYLGPANRADLRYAAPLRAASLQGLPPTWIQTAEYDVLRDEGEALGQRLQQAGVPVVLKRSPGMNHGFLKYAGVIAMASDGMTQACAWLRQQLAPEHTPLNEQAA